MTETKTETINVQIAYELEMDKDEFLEFLDGIPNFSPILEDDYDWYRNDCRREGLSEREFSSFDEWVWRNSDKIMKYHAQTINEYARFESFAV